MGVEEVDDVQNEIGIFDDDSSMRAAKPTLGSARDVMPGVCQELQPAGQPGPTPDHSLDGDILSLSPGRKYNRKHRNDQEKVKKLTSLNGYNSLKVNMALEAYWR
jgi:hypothetical protein